MPKKLSAEMVVEIQHAYFNEGLASQKVADKLHVRHKTVLKYIHKDGRTLRSKGWPEGKRQLARLGKSLPWLAPTEHPTQLDIAWAAGVFEGEGCVATKLYGIGAIISQRDPWLCERFRALFGGRVSHGFQHRTSAGAGNPISRWNVEGPRARAFLMTIYKFLSPQRQGQIRVAFENNGVFKAA